MYVYHKETNLIFIDWYFTATKLPERTDVPQPSKYSNGSNINCKRILLSVTGGRTLHERGEETSVGKITQHAL